MKKNMFFLFLFFGIYGFLSANSALAFDGYNDHVLLPDFEETNQGTIELWFKAPETTNNFNVFLSNAGIGQVTLAFYLEKIAASWYVNFACHPNYGWEQLSSPTAIPYEQWVHLAATWDGSFINLFVNGINVNSKSGYPAESVSQNWSLGCGTPTGSMEYFQGEMDEFRLWSVARSEAQIQEFMCASLSGTEIGLTAYYQMSNGSGTLLLDNSINGNSGILYDGTIIGNGPNWITDYLIPAGIGTIDNPYLIKSINHLYWLAGYITLWDKIFEQTADIDLISTQNWNGGNGFTPIGNAGNFFTGTYNGNGHFIENLYINRNLIGNNYIGFFGLTSNAVIQNLALHLVNVSGYNNTGALAGNCRNSMITNCYSTGQVLGYEHVGGLIGKLEITGSLLTDSYSTCDVTGTDEFAGGLAGSSSQANIAKCYFSGNVAGNLYIGGLIGAASQTDVVQSFSMGDVEGYAFVGGIVGCNGYYSTITDCYSFCNVIRSTGSNDYFGAFCSVSDDLSSITNSYSIGSVYDTDGISAFATNLGFVYSAWNSAYSNNFFDSESSNQMTAMGATAKTTAEMKTQSTFTNWNFSEVWAIDVDFNNGYPYFQWQYNAPTPPDSPENVQIYITENIVTITWNEVPDATAYKIYSSDAPDGEFTEETNGTFDGFSWSKVISDSKKFYHVKAMN